MFISYKFSAFFLLIFSIVFCALDWNSTTKKHSRTPSLRHFHIHRLHQLKPEKKHQFHFQSCLGCISTTNLASFKSKYSRPCYPKDDAGCRYSLSIWCHLSAAAPTQSGQCWALARAWGAHVPWDGAWAWRHFRISWGGTIDFWCCEKSPWKKNCFFFLVKLNMAMFKIV